MSGKRLNPCFKRIEDTEKPWDADLHGFHGSDELAVDLLMCICADASTVGDANFGQVTQARLSREIRLGVKLLW